MTDDIDWSNDAELEAIRASILKRARVEGIKVAYESALEVCRDKAAPAAAKASSQRTLLSVGDALDPRNRADAQQKQPHEMSSAELERQVRSFQLKLAATQDRNAADDVDEKDDDGGDEEGGAFT